MTTKVKNIQVYKDSQGEHIITKGILLLIKISTINKSWNVGQLCATGKNKDNYFISTHQIDNNVVEDRGYVLIKPVIISDTEDIEIGDTALDIRDNTLFLVEDELSNHWQNGNMQYQKSYCKKVLVESENFSPKHIQAIISYKLKHQSVVNIKCSTDHKIALSKDGHISLFHSEQVANWSVFYDEVKPLLQKYHLDVLDTSALFRILADDGYNAPVKSNVITDEEIKVIAENRIGTDMDSLRGGPVYDQLADKKKGFIDGFKYALNKK